MTEIISWKNWKILSLKYIVDSSMFTYRPQLCAGAHTTSDSSQRSFLFTFIKTSTGHPIHPSAVDTRRIGKLTVLLETPQLILNECEATDGVLYDSLGTKKLLHWA